MKFNLKTLKIVTLTTSVLALSLGAIADVKIIDEQYDKAVGHVAWKNQADIKPEEVINQPIPNNMTNLVFIRRYDNDPEQTGANIAVNDRFQVSLHPNGYTQVYSCAGMNFLSAEQTSLKTNDLLQKSSSFDLAANGTYYFYVDVSDDSNSSNITQITEESAQKILVDKKYQKHQISRVVPKCPVVKQAPPVPAPVLTPKPTPKPEHNPKPAPILEKEVRIELEVLFDTDKDIVKPQFAQNIREVAEFMNVYTNTTAIIEGHTDSDASIKYNQALSNRRATAVKNVLVNQFGIADHRLKSVGYGEVRPRATNKNSKGKQLNRRVIAVINERVRVDKNGNPIK